MQTGDCLASLGKVGLRKQDGVDPMTIKTSQLSGGYKARLVFLKMILENPSVILLDEPTNHLDMDTINYLLESLNNFTGGIMVITHDIDFIERLNNHQILEITDGHIKKHSNIDTYINTILT